MEKLNLDTNNLKRFGITMAIAFLVISLLILLKHRYIAWPVSALSFGFLLFGFFAPRLLKPVYTYWMKFAFILGWINTRILLFAIFYLVFAPIGLLMRLFRKDLLNLKIEKDKASYWSEKEGKDYKPSDYERQF